MDISAEESRRKWNVVARRQKIARMVDSRIDKAFRIPKKRSHHKKAETPSFTTDGTHLTILEAEKRINRSPNAIRKAIERGHIRQMLHGRKVFVNLEDLDAYPAKVIISQHNNGKSLAVRIKAKKGTV